MASMVTTGGILADIGTDHAYVPIALVQRQKIKGAIAMDINEGPLARAQEHIRAASSLISETNSACDLLLFPALGIIDQSGSPLLSDTLYFVIAELVAFEIEIPMNSPHIFYLLCIYFNLYIYLSIYHIHSLKFS